MKVTVWSTPNCQPCRVTKLQFDKFGVIYEEKNLEDYPDKLEEFKAKGLMQSPIVETETRIWSGFHLDKIKSLANTLFGEKKNG